MAAEKRTIFTSFNVMRKSAVAEGVIPCMKEVCSCGRSPFIRPIIHAPAANNTNSEMLRLIWASVQVYRFEKADTPDDESQNKEGKSQITTTAPIELVI